MLQKLNLPLIVHTRSAEKETLEILKDHHAIMISKFLFIVLREQRNLHFNFLTWEPIFLRVVLLLLKNLKI